jgi:hypothetical protein
MMSLTGGDRESVFQGVANLRQMAQHQTKLREPTAQSAAGSD